MYFHLLLPFMWCVRMCVSYVCWLLNAIYREIRNMHIARCTMHVCTVYCTPCIFTHTNAKYSSLLVVARTHTHTHSPRTIAAIQYDFHSMEFVNNKVPPPSLLAAHTPPYFIAGHEKELKIQCSVQIQNQNTSTRYRIAFIPSISV